MMMKDKKVLVEINKLKASIGTRTSRKERRERTQKKINEIAYQLLNQFIDKLDQTKDWAQTVQYVESCCYRLLDDHQTERHINEAAIYLFYETIYAKIKEYKGIDDEDR